MTAPETPDNPAKPFPAWQEKSRRAVSRLRRYWQEIPHALRHRQGVSHPSGTLPFTPPEQVVEATLAASWLGHASVLIRIGNQWVLTDPVFSHRIGIPVGPLTIGLGRLSPPPDPSRLPRPDVILLSHAHFDHLDKPTLRRFAGPHTRVITAAGTGRLVPRGFAQVDELKWNQNLSLGDVQLRAMQPRHWGARTAIDSHRGYNSYVIDASDRRVLFAGDTAMSDCFAPLARESKPIDLAIFGIGAYDPWIHNHASPEQAWEMFRQSGGRRMMPMHHSTFKLSDEPREEPLQRLLRIAGERVDQLVGLELGSTWLDAQ